MAVLQSSYTDAPANGYAGMVANGETSNRVSRIVEDAAGIGFGKAVFRGANDKGITATPAANRFEGVTIASYAPGPNTTTGVMEDKYQQRDTAAVMTLGAIWVVASVVVADMDPVFVTPAGAFTNVNGGGANFALTGWVWDSTTTAVGQLARIARR